MAAVAPLWKTVAGARRRMTPRRCHRCGEKYLRRNMFEAWTSQAPGHRRGWQKVTLKICTRCQGQDQAQKGLSIIESTMRPPKKD